MPVYEYACTACDEQLEVRQSFTDEALSVCPVCSGRLRKVLSAVGVVFKGSGFYRNDSRTASSPTDGSSDGGGEGSGSPTDNGAKEKGGGADANGSGANGRSKASSADTGSGSGSDGAGSSTSGDSPKKSSTAKAAAG